MPQPNTVQNPFLLMLAPETVLQAVERSAPLTSLRRRMCRPLDRGMPGTESVDGQAADGHDAPLHAGGDPGESPGSVPLA